MNYPTSFSENLIDIREFELSEHGSVAAEKLAVSGFYVSAGLRRRDVPEIGRLASSDPIREYCPNDYSPSRFLTEASTQEWLIKEREVFQLRSIGSGVLAGYGWTGPDKHKLVPGGDTTFALRVSPEFAGRGLGTPFTGAILAGSIALFGDRKIWLETWESNAKAVKTYMRNGAKLIAAVDGTRPTLTPTEDAVDGSRLIDTRLYMSF